jgi:hypothetical protein
MNDYGNISANKFLFDPVRPQQRHDGIVKQTETKTHVVSATCLTTYGEAACFKPVHWTPGPLPPEDNI